MLVWQVGIGTHVHSRTSLSVPPGGLRWRALPTLACCVLNLALCAASGCELDPLPI